MDRGALPTGLRPFAGWKPEALEADRPRLAIAAALAGDAVFREAVGEALDDRDLWRDAEATDGQRLVAAHGEDAALAALAARGRWDDLAALAAATADRLAAAGRAAADASRRQGQDMDLAARRRLSDDLAAARSDRDAARRRADAAEQREQAAAAERARLAGEVSALRAQVASLSAELAEERRRAARTADRLRRRATAAEHHARATDARAEQVAAHLTTLATELRTAPAEDPVATGTLAPDPRDAPAEDPGPTGALAPDPRAAPAEDSGPTGALAPGPRTAPAPGTAAPAPMLAPLPVAAPGRPCRLPLGVTEEDPLAVEALLRVPGIAVVLDGYNLTKDPAGRPASALADQRAWLLSLAAGVAARFERRLTVVFDGTEPVRTASGTPKGVTVVFSTGDETADDRIVAIVAGLDPAQPCLVVTSDREIRDDCTALGANVTPARAFLRAAGA